MENIFLPSKIELKEEKNSNLAILTVEPLYHGYGTTLGNALRRVLLSSLPGAAATAIKIKGAPHEFSALTGIYEDILQIVLNVKLLRLKLYSDEPVVLKVVKKGMGDVLAGDIAKDANVEIINPDLKIATITDKGTEFNMEIIVEKGRGFEPTENRSKENLSVGTIAIDSIFTPIKDVGFKVENTRVGQITNFDKLTLTLETDGTISPREAINFCAKMLIDHFNLLISETPEAPEEKEEENKAKIKKPKAKKAVKTSKKAKK
ncbi:MAG: DNA-directed RNA polymerase subunit alpha [Patescibacteria group bacterium]